MSDFAGVAVTPWSPTILMDEATLEPWPRQVFERRVREGYDAPAVRFDPPEGAFVGGLSLAAVAQTRGLVAESVHMNSRFRWPAAFAGVTAVTAIPGPALIAVNATARNYYHWTVQSLAALLVHRRLAGADAHALVPDLNHWRRGGVELLGLDAALTGLSPEHGIAIERAILTNLTGGDYAFAPHPAVLNLFQAPFAPSPRGRRRLYLSREDMGARRAMTNEAELRRLLDRHGVETIMAGSLPVRAQAALMRDAELIVAPHGGALANLVFAADGAAGPRVIELLQADYLNRCFLKIGQAKRLDYTVIVNPCARAGATPHLSSWTADLGLIEAALEGH